MDAASRVRHEIGAIHQSGLFVIPAGAIAYSRNPEGFCWTPDQVRGDILRIISRGLHGLHIRCGAQACLAYALKSYYCTRRNLISFAMALKRVSSSSDSGV